MLSPGPPRPRNTARAPFLWDPTTWCLDSTLSPAVHRHHPPPSRASRGTLCAQHSKRVGMFWCRLPTMASLGAERALRGVPARGGIPVCPGRAYRRLPGRVQSARSTWPCCLQPHPVRQTPRARAFTMGPDNMVGQSVENFSATYVAPKNSLKACECPLLHGVKRLLPLILLVHSTKISDWY